MLGTTDLHQDEQIRRPAFRHRSCEARRIESCVSRVVSDRCPVKLHVRIIPGGRVPVPLHVNADAVFRDNSGEHIAPGAPDVDAAPATIARRLAPREEG
jgi:hypothetical protein